MKRYYEMTFLFMAEHKFSLIDMENMYPYEFEIYAMMMKNKIEEELKRNGR